MKTFIQKNLIRIAIGIVCVLILMSALLSYFNKRVMREALVLKEQSNLALKEVDRVYQNIQLMDISSRGYALVREPAYLFWTVKMANDRNADIFKRLDSLFKEQGFENPKYYSDVKKGLNDYTNMYAEMVRHLGAHEDSLYMVLLKKDVGRYFWEVFNPFSKDVNAFEASRNQEAQATYETAVMRNDALQLLLIILGLPTLVWVVYTLAKDERERRSLLMNVQANNKKYLFDDGVDNGSEAKTILGKSIEDLQKAATFVNEISQGNYKANWTGLSENMQRNQQSLAGRLMVMRNEMIKVKEEDRKRMWATEGLSEFSQIIRRHQNNLGELTMNALTYLIKYCKSQQGSLFVLGKDEEDEPYLELTACYAFDRKKYIEKRVRPGEGLIGQAFLEGSTVLLKDVPKNYIAITSGLGDATPSCLIIVPLKHNEEVHAILEMASFKDYEPYEIEFLERAGEFIASAIASVQGNEQNKLVMEQMRSQTEQLRAQEEELRQNMEELEATNEEMRRKEMKV